jgi:hypothetical protein
MIEMFVAGICTAIAFAEGVNRNYGECAFAVFLAILCALVGIAGVHP